MPNGNGRTWEQTSNGWASRKSTADELKIDTLMQKWTHGLMDYKTVLKEIKRRKLVAG